MTYDVFGGTLSLPQSISQHVFMLSSAVQSCERGTAVVADRHASNYADLRQFRMSCVCVFFVVVVTRSQ